MKKDDILVGLIVATILVVGGIVCVLGWKAMHPEIYENPDYSARKESSGFFSFGGNDSESDTGDSDNSNNTVEYDEENGAYHVHSKIDYYIAPDAYEIATGNTDFEKVINDYFSAIVIDKDAKKAEKLVIKDPDIPMDEGDDPEATYNRIIASIEQTVTAFESLPEEELAGFTYAIQQAKETDMNGQDIMLVSLGYANETGTISKGSMTFFLIKTKKGWKIFEVG